MASMSPELGAYRAMLQTYAEGHQTPIDITIVLSRSTLLVIDAVERVNASLAALEKVVQATEKMADQLVDVSNKVTLILGVLTKANGEPPQS